MKHRIQTNTKLPLPHKADINTYNGEYYIVLNTTDDTYNHSYTCKDLYSAVNTQTKLNDIFNNTSIVNSIGETVSNETIIAINSHNALVNIIKQSILESLIN